MPISASAPSRTPAYIHNPDSPHQQTDSRNRPKTILNVRFVAPPAAAEASGTTRLIILPRVKPFEHPIDRLRRQSPHVLDRIDLDDYLMQFNALANKTPPHSFGNTHPRNTAAQSAGEYTHPLPDPESAYSPPAPIRS